MPLVPAEINKRVPLMRGEDIELAVVGRPFSSRTELEHYFDSDKLLCLICGQSFITLPPHLLRTHHISSDDYKIKFGIPFRYGLAGTAFKAASALRMRKLKEIGAIPAKPLQTTIDILTRHRKRRYIPMEVRQRENLQKLLTLHGKDDVWQPYHFEEFIRRLESGRTVKEVASDPDMPSRKALSDFLTKNPAMQERYDGIWERLPFDVQVRANKTGKSYLDTIRLLRTKGKSWKEISQIMRVNPSTLRNSWHYRIGHS